MMANHEGDVTELGQMSEEAEIIAKTCLVLQWLLIIVKFVIENYQIIKHLYCNDCWFNWNICKWAIEQLSKNKTLEFFTNLVNQAALLWTTMWTMMNYLYYDQWYSILVVGLNWMEPNLSHERAIFLFQHVIGFKMFFFMNLKHRKTLLHRTQRESLKSTPHNFNLLCCHMLINERKVLSGPTSTLTRFVA